MRRIPKDSPRYQTAVRRTKETMEANAMREAQEQLEKENRVRAIVGQPPQTLEGGTFPPFDNHSMPHPQQSKFKRKVR